MVIQRIQSVYLLLAGIIMAFYSFMDVVAIQTTSDLMIGVGLFKTSVISFILSLLVSCLSFIAIFKYKKLNIQIALCSCNLILLFAQITVLIISVFSQNEQSVQFFFSNAMPFLSMVLLILSINAIKHDKKVLNSYDRIR